MKLAVWGQASPLLTKWDEALGSGHLKDLSDRLQLLFLSPLPRCRRPFPSPAGLGSQKPSLYLPRFSSNSAG